MLSMTAKELTIMSEMCLTTDALMKPSTELIMKYTMPTTATLDAVGPSLGLHIMRIIISLQQ